MEDQRVLGLLSEVLKLHRFVSIIGKLVKGRDWVCFLVASSWIRVRCFESRCAVLQEVGGILAFWGQTCYGRYTSCRYTVPILELGRVYLGACIYGRPFGAKFCVCYLLSVSLDLGTISRLLSIRVVLIFIAHPKMNIVWGELHRKLVFKLQKLLPYVFDSVVSRLIFLRLFQFLIKQSIIAVKLILNNCAIFHWFFFYCSYRSKRTVYTVVIQFCVSFYGWRFLSRCVYLSGYLALHEPIGSSPVFKVAIEL